MRYSFRNEYLSHKQSINVHLNSIDFVVFQCTPFTIFGSLATRDTKE